MKFSHYPVLKALFPYLFGIIMGYFLPIYRLNLLFCILGLFFLSVFFIIKRKKRNFLLHNGSRVLLLFAFFFAGYLSVFFHYHKNSEQLNVEKMIAKQTWMAEIKETPMEREKSYKIIAKLTAANDTSYWITEKAILYFQKDSLIKKCVVGDKLMIRAQLSFVEPPKNPEQFNYQKFVKRKGIYFTGYVPTYSWLQMESAARPSVKKIASYLQRLLSDQLIASGLSGAEYGVAAAILLGNDETLEPELKASYAAAGVSHILCVSGMHVGIIFMILNFLLLPLGSSARVNHIRNVILLLSVWLYAHITGLSPSVTRAAAMFTFVIIGKLLQRQSNIFHSLFASLFILLVINPLLLFDVGFQLSYLAVFGIVIFQKMIAGWVHPKTKFGNYIWNLASVSVAAQLTTFPVAIYYFGQFPNYFLLSNLSVIALSFVIVVSGVATLAFSFFPFLSNCIGFLTSIEVKVMNTIIIFIEKLPGAVTANISIHVIQVIILYIIIFIFIFQKHKIKLIIFSVLILFNIFIFIYITHRYNCTQHIDVVEYNIQKCTAFQFCYQGNALIFSDSIHNENDKRYQFNIQNHDRKKRIHNTFLNINQDFENDFLCKKGNCIFFQNKMYVIERNRLKPNTLNLVVYENNLTDGGIHTLN
jgi:competence protein ComEC